MPNGVSMSVARVTPREDQGGQLRPEGSVSFCHPACLLQFAGRSHSFPPPHGTEKGAPLTPSGRFGLPGERTTNHETLLCAGEGLCQKLPLQREGRFRTRPFCPRARCLRGNQEARAGRVGRGADLPGGGALAGPAWTPELESELRKHKSSEHY